MNGDFDLVKELVRNSQQAFLATIGEGAPLASAAGYVFEEKGDFGTIVLLLSDLARHTRNLKKNPALCLLVVEPSDAPIHEKKRASFSGEARLVEDRGRIERLKKAYLVLFPRSEIFLTLPDFRFYELEPRTIGWIGGFGRAKDFVFTDGRWEEIPRMPARR
jgi:putative heme iron utilization protein